MLKKLYKLKANRGFTIVELVVVVAIIAILTGTIIGGTNTQRKKILAANDTARDFYGIHKLPDVRRTADNDPKR